MVMSEAALKQYMGWTQGSKMAAIYVHMSGKDTDEAILRANGLDTPEKPRCQPLKPVVCVRCGTVNGATGRFCSVCSLPLAEDAANEVLREEAKKARVAELMESLLKDPETLQLLARKLNHHTPNGERQP